MLKMKYFWIILFIIVWIYTESIQGAPCNTSLSTVSDKAVYEYGDTIHFRCDVFNVEKVDISELSLINLQSNVSTVFINATGNTCYTNIGVHSSNITGPYSCRYGNCSEDTLLSIVHIEVDPCSDPRYFDVRPTIECTIRDVSSMYCRWTTVHTDKVCGSWRAMYITQVLAQNTCCSDHVTATSVDACADSGLSCAVPATDVFLGFNYTFVLSRETTHGKEIYNYTIFAGNSIVSVDIDKDVIVQPGSGPRDLRVIFTMHHSPASVHGIVCNVTYTSQWGDTNMAVVPVNQISLDVNVTINKLIPYTMYTFNIKCRPRSSRYWSNKVTGNGRTLSTVPDSTPGLMGYSTQITLQNLTQIYLYLKPVPVYKWCGDEFRYVITMVTMVDNGVDNDVYVVDMIDGHTITPELLHQIPANKTYKVEVRSENEAGESQMVESLNIATTETAGTSVVVEESVIGTVVTLFPPRSGNNITGVTFYRCQGQPDVYPPVCKKELYNETVSGFMLTFFWPSYLTNISEYTWHYGVTIHRQADGGDRHIVWSNCVFRENKIARDTTLDVSAMFDSVNSSIVMVTLHFDYCSLRHRPTQYHVGVWNSATNITDYCSQHQSELQHFTATPSMHRLQVDVGHITNPLLCVRVQYQNDYDVSGEIEPQYSLRFHQKAVGASVKTLNSADITMAVIGSIIGCLVLAILVVVIRRFRYRLLKQNKLPLRVMTSMLESAPHVIENIPKYTIDTVSINSSGYESHQVTSSEQVQNLSNVTSVMFTNLYYSDDTPIDTASNSDGSEPILNYTQIRHRENTVQELNGNESMSNETLDNIETNRGVCEHSDSSTDATLVLNYAIIQTRGANGDGDKVNSRDNLNNIVTGYGESENINSSAGDTLSLNYATLQTKDAYGDGGEVEPSATGNEIEIDQNMSEYSSSSTDDTPTLNYATLQAGEANSYGGEFGSMLNVNSIETHQDVYGNSSSNTSILNYAHIQVGDVNGVEIELDSKVNVNNVEINQDLYENGNSPILNYAHLQARDEKGDNEIGVNYRGVSHNNRGFVDVGYEQSRENDEADDETTVLSYIQVESASTDDTGAGDTGTETEEEPHGVNNDHLALKNPELSENLEIITQNRYMYNNGVTSTIITGIIEDNTGEYPSDSVQPASASSEISDTDDDDNDVIDSYSQFTIPNEISSGYAVASIADTSNSTF